MLIETDIKQFHAAFFFMNESLFVQNKGMWIFEIPPYNVFIPNEVNSYILIWGGGVFERLFKGVGDNNFNYYNNIITPLTDSGYKMLQIKICFTLYPF